MVTLAGSGMVNVSDPAVWRFSVVVRPFTTMLSYCPESCSNLMVALPVWRTGLWSLEPASGPQVNDAVADDHRSHQRGTTLAGPSFSTTNGRIERIGLSCRCAEPTCVAKAYSSLLASVTAASNAVPCASRRSAASSTAKLASHCVTGSGTVGSWRRPQDASCLASASAPDPPGAFAE